MTSNFRIATWNVGRPTKNCARNSCLLDHIHHVGADIWILTETNHVINPGPEFWGLSTPASTWGKPGERAATIWSRFPISSAIVTFADGTDENLPPVGPTYAIRGPATSPAICTVIETPIGPLLVHGTIITWLNDKGPRDTSDFGREHCASIESHHRDWLRLAENKIACVAGDFNVIFNGYRYGEREKLQYALDAIDLVCLTNPLADLVDHICLSRAWSGLVVKSSRWDSPLFNGELLSPGHPAATSIDLPRNLPTSHS